MGPYLGLGSYKNACAHACVDANVKEIGNMSTHLLSLQHFGEQVHGFVANAIVTQVQVAYGRIRQKPIQKHKSPYGKDNLNSHFTLVPNRHNWESA